MLIRQSLVKNIDPSSKEAPRTMKEAKERLYTQEELREEKVWIVVDGEKDSPNIIIADNGEGQEPCKFEETLLSLQTGNKNSIGFVQGKFNMGSTGAVVFCGKHKYQLIISRRNRNITRNQEKIGFTIVRKHIRNKKEQETLKNTWYEFLTVDNIIPSFEEDKIVLCDDFNRRYTYTDGTIVKLFNYQLAKKSQAFQSLKFAINALLYNPVFEVDVHESRRCFEAVAKRKGIMNSAKGNWNILKNDIENQDYQIVDYILEGDSFGKAKISVFVYKENSISVDQLNQIRQDKPVVFLMNGQVQYSLSRSYISQNLNLKLIKNHMFVVIDCTDLKKEFHDDGFFMANRENIRQTEKNKAFLNDITEFLKNNEELIKVNKQRASEKVSSSGTQELFEKLLGKNKQDNFLANMFRTADYGVQDNKDKRNTSGKSNEAEDIVKKKYPTFVKMRGEDSKESKNVSVERGKGFTITLELDAYDDYFDRVYDGGELQIQVTSQGLGGKGGGNIISTIGENGVQKWFDIIRSDYKNGIIKFTLISNKNEVKVGDEFRVKINIKDNQQEFNKNVLVHIKDREKTNGKKDKNNSKSKLSLPPIILVYKNQELINKMKKSPEEKATYKTWDSIGWGEDGAKKIVKIQPATSENEIANAIFINMSSDALSRIIHEEGTAGTKVELSQEQFMTTIYSQSFLSVAALNKMLKEQPSLKHQMGEIEIEDFVGDMIQEMAYAAVKMQINNITSNTNI